MKNIIGLVLVIVALVGGIVGGMILAPQGEVEKKDHVPDETDFKTKQFLYIKFDKPVIIPIFQNNKASGMLVVEIWLELEEGTDTVTVGAKEPRLRDELMQVFYLYASEGKFSEQLLDPTTQAELRRDLTNVARQYIGENLHAILINDMQRQDLL